jgi:hypothetical protein
VRWFLILAAWLGCVLAPIQAQNTKPLGAWFGGYEKLTFDDELAWP